MDLGKHVVDKEIMDRDGRRLGKVDDLLLEVPEPEGDAPSAQPTVVAIISGPLALSQDMSRPVRWLARATYRLLGLADPRPTLIPWRDVTAIDVVVHVDVGRTDIGWSELVAAVNRRFIERIPGA